MKSTINKKIRQLPATNDASSLRMVYKNEEIINDPANAVIEKEKAINKTRLFVKESLPLFNDYKFKYKDHDPL
jgi:hypothetical protein